MVRPTMRHPWECSRAATAELSTPPDMATAMRSVSDTCGTGRGKPAKLLRGDGHGLDERVHLIQRVFAAEREADGRTCRIAREPHRQQHVRRLHGAAGACRTAGHGESFQVE